MKIITVIAAIACFIGAITAIDRGDFFVALIFGGLCLYNLDTYFKME